VRRSVNLGGAVLLKRCRPAPYASLPRLQKEILLKNEGKSMRIRLGLLVAVLAIFAVAMVGPQQRAALAVCPDAALVYMYSDATYTTKVGQCVHACCQVWTCTGTLTNYQKVIYEVSCSTE
jgi:hypothetical protein